MNFCFSLNKERRLNKFCDKLQQGTCLMACPSVFDEVMSSLSRTNQTVKFIVRWEPINVG